ncbi:MAG: 4Fe-4S dicluster domain-containing protein [Candidatus Azobacteroides sp.]|nr:4Fe-4S dicluster domain-containing protein [Candidatus Azobacteroides sp.]
MNDIISQARSLLENKTVDIFIGYEKGTRGPRPAFISKSEDADKLIFDESCSGNLAVYLTRKDLTEGKKVGISASYYALKNLALLFDECQLKEENLRVIAFSGNGDLKLLQSAEEIKQHVEGMPAPVNPAVEEQIRKIEAMTLSERWAFWTEELSRCFKCYACRWACPMCYCTKCIVEVNRPQWVQPWAGTLTNIEWQINRVMHMAGRCSECGACGAACPLGIPIYLLNKRMADQVKENFGKPGEEGNVLSTFKPDDKENFIV